MDTDSLITLITSKNIYVDMNDNIEFYDTSNFDKNIDKPVKLGMHCKIPGLLKDELANTELKEGIFDGPKAYFLTCFNGEKIKKSKGTKKNYELELKRKRPNYKKQTVFKSNDLHIYLIECFKSTIPTKYDKRIVVNNSHITITYG